MVFGAQARPDRDRIPAFSKAGIRHPPRHRGYANTCLVKGIRPDGHRRRCESAMPTTQASPAVGATRPLRRRAATGREGLHTKRSFQEGKGKTDALTLIASVFSECCQGQALGAQARPLTEIEYPLLVKRVFSHPPPLPPRLRRCFPTATAADASRLCRPRRRRRPSGATRPLRRRAATGRGGTSHQTQSPRG